MDCPVEAWHRAHHATIAAMKQTFEKNDLRMVTVKGLPENDQCWIDACIQFKPIRFAGNLGFCWLYFETSAEAFKFASAMHGKTFKEHLITAAGTHLPEPSDFSQLILDLQEIAAKHMDELEYDIKLSELECCKECGKTFVKDQ